MHKPLSRVEPSRTTLVMACPCEKAAARVRGKTVDALALSDEKKAIATVAQRYLQARHGQHVTAAEAAIYGTLHTPLSPTCFVNIRNTRRYKKTKRHAKAFLQAHLTEAQFTELQKLHYTNADLPRAKQQLTAAGADTSEFPAARFLATGSKLFDRVRALGRKGG